MYGDDMKARVIELYLDGRSAVEVAEMTGVSHGTVSRWVNERGVKRRTAPCTYGNLKADASHPSHGKLSGYEAGCRCRRCRNARKVFDKKCQLRRTLRRLGE